MKQRIFPEALVGKRGEKWKVSEAPGWSGATEVGKKIMFIPGADDPIAHNIRLHELAHATWSPKENALMFARKWGVTPEAVQRAEDARIGIALAKIRPEYREGILKDLDKPEVQEQIISSVHKGLLANRAQTLRLMVLELASLCMTQQAAQLTELFLEGAKRVEEAVGADLVQGVRRLLSDVKVQLIYLGRVGYGRSIASLRQLREMAKYLDALVPPPPKVGEPEDGRPEKKKREIQLDHGRGWGRMQIVRPPLCRPQNLAMRRMRIRATEEGAVPGRIERLFTDGAIFSRVERQRGASVLLDISGSMGLSTEEIKDFLTRIPAATIATYCGGGGGVGHLRIIAERGKIASDNDMRVRYGQNNLIDGPALEWLGAQPLEPRLWVSDGQVTGIGDVCSAGLSAIAEAICLRHKILRIESLEEAIRFLGGRRARSA